MQRQPTTSGAPARADVEPDLLFGGADRRLGPSARRRLGVIAAVAVLSIVTGGEPREQAADQHQQAVAASSTRAAEPRPRDDAVRPACGPEPAGGPMTARYANRQERDEAYEVGLAVRTAVATDHAAPDDVRRPVRPACKS